MTSSVKPEVCNMSQRHQRKNEPQTQVTYLKNVEGRSNVQIRIYARGQTDRQTRSSQYFASEVMSVLDKNNT